MQVEEISHNVYPTTFLNNSNVVEEIKFHPTVHLSLNNIIKKEGFTSHKILKRKIASDGGNYMGELYEINIRGETKHGIKEINIFLKHIISGDVINDVMDIEMCYLRELFIYGELRNIINALQEGVNIPEKERFRMVKSYEECNTKAVILDNLGKKGYKTLYRKDVMTLKFAEQAIIQLAKFHGLSFVIENKRHEYFERKLKTMHSLFKFNKQWVKIIEKQFDICYGYFDYEIQKKIKAFLPTFYEKLPKYYRGETDSVRCVCHGDFRLNNLMVKQNNEEEDEVFIIDYQLLFYGSPVIDILYFIYTGTDRKFRTAHLTHLKNLYHHKLADFINYFGLDIKNIYPKESFERDFNETLDFGLMVSFYILPFCFIMEEEVPDFNKGTIDDIEVKVDEGFKDRITEIVEDYIDWGILK